MCLTGEEMEERAESGERESRDVRAVCEEGNNREAGEERGDWGGEEESSP
jgi:hypothetical protein